MTNDVTITRPPWLPAERTTEELVDSLRNDFAYAVRYTAILVHSKHEALQILVNTPRGQIIPRNECRFTDGSSFELQDVGMPQPGAPNIASVSELLRWLWEIAQELNLELAP
jgi:hypothetical protein